MRTSHFHKPQNLNGYRYNDRVDFECEPGYVLYGPKVLSCVGQNSSYAKWNDTQPTCNRINCTQSSLVIDRHVSIVPRKQTYDYMDTVILSCESGYTGKPVSSQCIDVNHWSMSSLQCSPVQCPDLNETVHLAAMKLTGYNYPSSVTFRCEDGYRIKGVSELHCKAHVSKSVGMWDNIQPSCLGIPCPELMQTSHLLKPQTLSGYRYNNIVHFKCEAGYVLSGPEVLGCTMHNHIYGKWNDTQPTCNRINCTLSSLAGKPYITFGQSKQIYDFNETVTISCKSGYRGNATKSQCIAINKWSLLPPQCSHQSTKAFPVGAVGGGAGTAVALILAIGVILIVIIRRKRKQKKSDDRLDEKQIDFESGDISNVETIASTTTVHHKENETYYNHIDTGDGDGYYAFCGKSQIPKTAVLVSDLYAYIGSGSGVGGNIELEFSKLDSGLQKSTSTALMSGNKVKNKYRDLYAYDETRVLLDKLPEVPNSDYINACFIHGYGQVKKYIASQGPIDTSVNDFWRMVWQYDCGKIVMLTNVFEEGKQKCVQYWPDSEKEKVSFGSICVSLLKEEIFSDFIVRTMKIQKENKTKTVTQFHFTAWPDKDIPKYSSSLVHFRHKVIYTQVALNGPLLVHCSAGIGRTGTFIGLDFAVNQAKEVDYVDIFGCVEALRRQRVNMVQTANQYIFLHDAVLEALMCPNSGIPCKDFPDVYRELMTFDTGCKKHKLLLEYEVMNSFSMKHDEEVFERGKSAENKHKNRYSNIIPVGSEMPLLYTSVAGQNEYINAVFLPGHKNSKAFIITQMPLEWTAVDFWRLVYDYEIKTIVMLNEKEKVKDKYWPDTPASIFSSGPFTIQQNNKDVDKLFDCLELTISYQKRDNRRLKLIQSNFWTDDAVVPETADDLLNLLVRVDNKHDTGGSGPILVHCLNGCDKSGLYCVLATVLERLRIEQDVDIQHVIKQMRNRRPQIIPNYEQFQFIYEAVIEYLKQFETYSNFQ